MFFIAFVYAKGSHEPDSVKYSLTTDRSSGVSTNKKVDFDFNFSTMNLNPLHLRYAVKYKSDVI
jgi:hypothetical protein